MIVLWSGSLSAVFFGIINKCGLLRLSEQDEILGGDLYYFGPIDFHGQPKDYDLKEILKKQIKNLEKKDLSGHQNDLKKET